VTSIIDGLKKLYIEKLKPLEVAYHFNDFVSPILVCTISLTSILAPVVNFSICKGVLAGSHELLWVNCRQRVTLMPSLR
jgi:hypothetical protein